MTSVGSRGTLGYGQRTVRRESLPTRRSYGRRFKAPTGELSVESRGINAENLSRADLVELYNVQDVYYVIPLKTFKGHQLIKRELNLASPNGDSSSCVNKARKIGECRKPTDKCVRQRLNLLKDFVGEGLQWFVAIHYSLRDQTKVNIREWGGRRKQKPVRRPELRSLVQCVTLPVRCQRFCGRLVSTSGSEFTFHAYQ